MTRYYCYLVDRRLVALRDAIRATIPPLIKLLKDQYSDVRSTATHSVGKFTQHGKRMQAIIPIEIDIWTADLREAISKAILSLIEPLKNANSGDRAIDLNAGVAAIGALADQGEP